MGIDVDKEFREEIMAKFGPALKRLRISKYKTAKECAVVLGVAADRYRHWERGTALPGLGMFMRICTLFKVNPNDLLPTPPSRR